MARPSMADFLTGLFAQNSRPRAPTKPVPQTPADKKAAELMKKAAEMEQGLAGSRDSPSAIDPRRMEEEQRRRDEEQAQREAEEERLRPLRQRKEEERKRQRALEQELLSPPRPYVPIDSSLDGPPDEYQPSFRQDGQGADLAPSRGYLDELAEYLKRAG